MNQKFSNALKGHEQSCPPIWFMRQAGRYHQHYQGLKKSYSFEQLCKTPKLAAETAMGPMGDFDFDVAILFSDILFPLEGLGMGLTYDPAPRLSFQLSYDTRERLSRVEGAIEFLKFQGEALKETRKVLPESKSLIGFVGGPWTLFTYATEGAHKGNLLTCKNERRLWHGFSEKILKVLEGNIKSQLESGAEVVMVFDTASGEVSSSFFHKEIVPGLKKLSQSFPGRLGYYSKGTVEEHLDHPDIRSDVWAGHGVDHRFNLVKLLKSGKFPGFLQGNFDQALLFGRPEDLRVNLDDYLKPFRELTPKERRHWVCGLGHGVLPKTPEENVKFFVQRVREIFSDA